jgi:hypothetical protein
MFYMHFPAEGLQLSHGWLDEIKRGMSRGAVDSSNDADLGALTVLYRAKRQDLNNKTYWMHSTYAVML